MSCKRLILAVVLTMSSSVPAAAATLYVNNSGSPACSDATTKASNSAASPWCTIGRAAWGSTNRSIPNASQAAQAGDTVEVSAGIYNFSGSLNHRFQVVYNPVNEGTNGANVIRFLAMGTVNLTASTTASPVIGCNERDYVVWQGPFTLNEASISISADTGTVALVAATGCGIDGVSIDGDGAPGYIDNHNGVRIEDCQSCYVRNSTIFDVRHEVGNHNGSGVMLYNSDNSVIENNHIFDVDNAVFIKGVFGGGADAQSGTIVRRNLLTNCDECITISDSRDSRIYQNVIRDTVVGVNLLGREPDPLFHPVGDWIVNNTFDNISQVYIILNGTTNPENVRVWNNIFTNCAPTAGSTSNCFANYREGGLNFSSGAVVDWEHNNYFGFPTRFAKGNDVRYDTFASWTAAFAHDLTSPGSITSDPLYANGVANDFRLCTAAGVPDASCTGASPALRLAVDILDLDADGNTADVVPAGAFVTNLEVIGPGVTPTLPSQPTNLRIVPGS